MTDDNSKTAPQISDLVREKGGGIYIGKSATTGKDLYAAPADLSDYKTFEEALAVAKLMRELPGRERPR